MIYYIIDILTNTKYKLTLNTNFKGNIYKNTLCLFNKYFNNQLDEFYITKFDVYYNTEYAIFLSLKNNLLFKQLNNDVDIEIQKILDKEFSNFILYKKAIEIAKIYHKNQTYDKIKLPYFYHLEQTDKILDKFVSYLPNNKIFILKTCAILHDILEDTNYLYDDINNNFSKEIADIVLSVTKDKEFNDLPYNENYEKRYYEQVIKNKLGIFIKFADKCANNLQNTKVLSQKRALQSLNQHKLFVDIVYKCFDCNTLKRYLNYIMFVVKHKNNCF